MWQPSPATRWKKKKGLPKQGNSSSLGNQATAPQPAQAPPVRRASLTGDSRGANAQLASASRATSRSTAQIKAQTQDLDPSKASRGEACISVMSPEGEQGQSCVSICSGLQQSHQQPACPSTHAPFPRLDEGAPRQSSRSSNAPESDDAEPQRASHETLSSSSNNRKDCADSVPDRGGARTRMSHGAQQATADLNWLTLENTSRASLQADSAPPRQQSRGFLAGSEGARACATIRPRPVQAHLTPAPAFLRAPTFRDHIHSSVFSGPLLALLALGAM